MNSFSKAFNINKDELRIRSFEFAGHTFKVRVPLTVESDLMNERLKTPNELLIKKFFEEMSKDLTEGTDKVVITEDDIIYDGNSIKKFCKDKAIVQERITLMLQYLVPEEDNFDMSTITYEMIDELFPYAIQLELVKLISETISPSYNVTKGK
jgi:hypothetical protein